VLTNPGIVLLVGHVIETAFAGADAVAQVPAGFEDEPGPFGERPNLYFYYLGATLLSMGWPLFLLCVCAIAYAAWRRRPPDVILLSFGLANYLAIAGTTSEVLYYPRYALPIIIVLLVLAGRLSADLLLALPRWRAWVGALGAAILIAWPASQASVNNQVLTRPDTRTLAKRWIDANIPEGSHILIEGGKIAPSRETVPLSESPESLDRRIAYWISEDPRQARFLQIRRAVHTGAGYALEIVKPDTMEAFDEYVARGVEYFVVRPETLENSRRAGVASSRLLESLRSDNSTRLIKRFEEKPGVRPGPTIEVYQRKPVAVSE
jgi:hypothetical protein